MRMRAPSVATYTVHKHRDEGYLYRTMNVSYVGLSLLLSYLFTLWLSPLLYFPVSPPLFAVVSVAALSALHAPFYSVVADRWSPPPLSHARLACSLSLSLPPSVTYSILVRAVSYTVNVKLWRPMRSSTWEFSYSQFSFYFPYRDSNSVDHHSVIVDTFCTRNILSIVGGRRTLWPVFV